MRTSATDDPTAVLNQKSVSSWSSADRLTLNHGHDDAAVLRELQKADHGEGDREDAEIFRRKDPREDDGHCDVEAEMQRLRYEDGSSAANGAALQIVDVGGRWGAIVRIPERNTSVRRQSKCRISVSTRWRDRILIACGSDKSLRIGSYKTCCGTLSSPNQCERTQARTGPNFDAGIVFGQPLGRLLRIQLVGIKRSKPPLCKLLQCNANIAPSSRDTGIRVALSGADRIK